MTISFTSKEITWSPSRKGRSRRFSWMHKCNKTLLLHYILQIRSPWTHERSVSYETIMICCVQYKMQSATRRQTSQANTPVTATGHITTPQVPFAPGACGAAVNTWLKPIHHNKWGLATLWPRNEVFSVFARNHGCWKEFAKGRVASTTFSIWCDFKQLILRIRLKRGQYARRYKLDPSFMYFLAFSHFFEWLAGLSAQGRTNMLQTFLANLWAFCYMHGSFLGHSFQLNPPEKHHSNSFWHCQDANQPGACRGGQSGDDPDIQGRGHPKSETAKIKML